MSSRNLDCSTFEFNPNQVAGTCWAEEIIDIVTIAEGLILIQQGIIPHSTDFKVSYTRSSEPRVFGIPEKELESKPVVAQAITVVTQAIAVGKQAMAGSLVTSIEVATDIRGRSSMAEVKLLVKVARIAKDNS